jgi:peptidoglycan hydrolase CwlO-like protein
MNKILLIISIILMGVATFFGYQNGRAFTAIRDEKAGIHKAIKRELGGLNELVAEIGKVNTQINTVQGELDVAAEQLKAKKLQITQTEGETKRSIDEYDAKNKKVAEYTEQLKKLPPDIKPESLEADLNKIKLAIQELTASAEAKKKEVEGELEKVKTQQVVLGDLVKKIEDRKKAFDRNALTARVIAVNNDWGFVVVDAGNREGITPDTKLLVTRGTQTVGKLSILAVEGNRTVANILVDSLTPGLTPMPGDRVILENLFGS